MRSKSCKTSFSSSSHRLSVDCRRVPNLFGSWLQPFHGESCGLRLFPSARCCCSGPIRSCTGSRNSFQWTCQDWKWKYYGNEMKFHCVSNVAIPFNDGYFCSSWLSIFRLQTNMKNTPKLWRKLNTSKMRKWSFVSSVICHHEITSKTQVEPITVNNLKNSFALYKQNKVYEYE